MKELNALRDEVFAINKANGWHDEKRAFGELIALVHSEVSEALEDYRNGKAINEVWYEYKRKELFGEEFHEILISDEPTELGMYGEIVVLGKPCGIPSELADIVIRILDICGLYGWNLDNLSGQPNELMIAQNFGTNLTIMHMHLSDAFRNREIDRDSDAAAVELLNTICIVEEMCKREEIDLDKIIREKLEYNKTRGYKHGGKVI